MTTRGAIPRFDSNNLDGTSNDRPNAIANHVNATHAQWADGFDLPKGFFTAPCLGCLGNLGRNTFVGPGYWAVDTSIFKNFRLSDRLRPAIPRRSVQRFQSHQFPIGRDRHEQPERSLLRPGGRHIQSAPVAIRNKTHTLRRRRGHYAFDAERRHPSTVGATF